MNQKDICMIQCMFILMYAHIIIMYIHIHMYELLYLVYEWCMGGHGVHIGKITLYILSMYSMVV